MEMDDARRRAIGSTLLALLVLALGFAPWGTAEIRLGTLGQDLLPGSIRLSTTTHLRLNAWNGTLELLGLDCPNWFVVLATAAAAALAWLSASGVWRAPTGVLLAPVLYALVHCAWFCGTVLLSERLRLGAGAGLTLLATAGILAVLRPTRPGRGPGAPARRRAAGGRQARQV